MTVDDAWVCSGESTVPVPTPCDFIPPAAGTPVTDVAEALAACLAAPTGTPPLRKLAGGARSAAIAIPDHSRPCRSDLLLPALLDTLNGAGVPDEAVTVLVGCGLHRGTTAAERQRLAGPAAERVRVLDSQGLESTFADLGSTASGLPVHIHEAAADADIVISVGILEPHLYAGYSGGVKGLAIGCAGEPTIAWTHRPAFISHPGVELCRLDGNPFQAALRDIAARTRLAFAVNVVVDDRCRVIDLDAGDPIAAQEALAARCGPAWLRQVERQYDVVVAGIKAPKHESLYQASRAATHLVSPARPALVEGGLILLCADLALGIGDGPAEENFARLLAETSDMAGLVERGLCEPLGPGGQRAFVMARSLCRYRVGVCGNADADLLTSLGMTRYASLAEGLADAHTTLRRAPRILAVADALTTVVRLADGAQTG